LKELELGPRCGNINILVEFDFPIWKGVAPAQILSAHPVMSRGFGRTTVQTFALWTAHFSSNLYIQQFPPTHIWSDFF
jgi:hypothetical protein